MTYSMMVGKYKLIFSDTHFKDFRKKPTISVYDADTNSETKIASFNSQKVFEWFVEAVVEADRKTENCSEKPNNCKDLQDWKDRMWAEAIVTEPTISKMEQVEDEPQPNADQHTQDVGSVGSVEQTEMPEYEAWKEPFEAMTDCPWK